MYNVEKYIANCLESILQSDLQEGDYEVLVVNDGSTDNSAQIAQKYESEHDNFMVLTQKNQGQGVARNYGIKECSGEYIWFVDSDDMIDSNISQILQRIEAIGKPDVFSFFLKYVSEKGDFLTKAFQFPGEYNKLMMGREAILSGYQPSSVCVFYMKRSFVIDNDLWFYPGIYHQDSEFSYRMMAYAKQVYFSDYVPYIYIKHPNSVVTSTSVEKLLKKQMDNIVIMESFQKLSKSFAISDPELSNKISNHVDDMVFGCVYGLYQNRKEWKSMGINKAVLAKIKEERRYPMKGPFKSWKKKLAAMFLNLECVVS